LNYEVIAGRVAQAVVHHFEAVNVNKQHRELVLRMPLRTGKFMLQAVSEQSTIGEVR
jgi:hypothetical protein